MQLQQLRLDQLNFSSHPVRLQRSETQMEVLRQSLKATDGPIDPLLVRDLGGEEYIVVAGESRLQALLDNNYPLDYKVPCLVGDFEDEQAIEYALIENVVRKSLTPYEEALAVYRLVEHYQYGKAQVAQKLGRKNSYISNLLKIFDLIEPIQTALHEGEITLGHAQALARLEDKPGLQQEGLDQIRHRGLSVKATRTLVEQLLGQDEEWFLEPGTIWISDKARLDIQSTSQGMQIRANVTTPAEYKQLLDQLQQRQKNV